jgi:cytochrome c-type biogenesis protein
MDFGPGTYGLGYLAGVLSTLSPCVLPLLPILIISAGVAHRMGPLALALGLAISFSGVGILIGSAGAALGLDPDIFRTLAAVVLLVLGVVMVSERLQQRFAAAAAGLSSHGNDLLSGLKLDGLRGQFLIGLVLGLVWSPCVGPTLGAATTLASQGQHLAQIALLMALFGLGAGTPLVLLGALPRAGMARVSRAMSLTGKWGKLALGAAMILLAIAILTGLDKSFEAFIVDVSPDWLTRLTTRF